MMVGRARFETGASRSRTVVAPGAALSREGGCSGASNHAAANNGTCEYLRSNPPSLGRQLSTTSDPPAIPIISLTVSPLSLIRYCRLIFLPMSVDTKRA
jgi:hypothetical protein